MVTTDLEVRPWGGQVTDDERATGGLRDELATAMSDAVTALAAADRLCQACVELLEVDGASISLADKGTTRGTFGSSGELSRRLDELQFTFGEGPCLDAVREGVPVMATDLGARHERRWPAFKDAVLGTGVRAVFALPVSLATSRVGALDLYNERPGSLSDTTLTGGLLAARLAALPLLAVMTAHSDMAAHTDTEYGWDQLSSLERVEVYQATGMIMVALDVDPGEALVRLRAHAFSCGLTASELAFEIVERRIDPGGGGFRRPADRS